MCPFGRSCLRVRNCRREQGDSKESARDKPRLHAHQRGWPSNLRRLKTSRRRLPRWFVRPRLQLRAGVSLQRHKWEGLAHLFHLSRRRDTGVRCLPLISVLSCSSVCSPFHPVPFRWESRSNATHRKKRTEMWWKRIKRDIWGEVRVPHQGTSESVVPSAKRMKAFVSDTRWSTSHSARDLAGRSPPGWDRECMPLTLVSMLLRRTARNRLRATNCPRPTHATKKVEYQ